MAVETNTRKIVARLHRKGWSKVPGGRHDKFKRSGKPLIVVPRHRTLSPGVAVDRKGCRLDLMTRYVGILDGADDVWGVRIPDVPGCHGAGKSPEAAVRDAVSALREVAAHYATEGIELNPPRSILQIKHDKDAEYNSRAGEILVGIPLLLDRGRLVKANISLDAGLLETIDEEAERRGLTRSSFLVSAAIDKIEGRSSRRNRKGKKKRKKPTKPRMRA
jgi:predicted RNase H-like HicB family nuclease/predicted RNA binding protein YcfA (HicA-like mRNA interferase family)